MPYRVRAIPAILVCLSLFGAAACGTSAGTATGGAGGGGGRGRGGDTGPVPVVVGTVAQKDVPVEIAAIGNVEAYNTITIRAQITGTLMEVAFNEGANVKKGDLLFKIDPRPYQAALEQAQATLVRDRALLAQSEAQLKRDLANAEFTKADARRQQELVSKGILSKTQGDQASASSDANEALVNADKAAIDSAKAQLDAQVATIDSAKLQLEYCVIKSPIDGKTGDLAVKAGNLVTANNEALLTITQVDPVYVVFSVPAVHLPQIKQHSNEMEVMATPQEAGAQPIKGQLTFVDNVVDPSTDTIKLKATFKNPSAVLWPGQFARVSLKVATLAGASVVPTQAVQTGQDGQFVFVVKPDSTVEQRSITSGDTVGQEVVIASGLQPGETIVLEGQLRLEPGSRITRADPKTGEAAPTAGGRGRGRSGQGGGGQGGGQGRGPAGQGGPGQGGPGQGQTPRSNDKAQPATPSQGQGPGEGRGQGRMGRGNVQGQAGQGPAGEGQGQGQGEGRGRRGGRRGDGQQGSGQGQPGN